jgi:hypothetical protein
VFSRAYVERFFFAISALVPAIILLRSTNDIAFVITAFVLLLASLFFSLSGVKKKEVLYKTAKLLTLGAYLIFSLNVILNVQSAGLLITLSLSSMLVTSAFVLHFTFKIAD